MPEKKTEAKSSRPTRSRAAAAAGRSVRFTDEERAAMREHAKELRAAKRGEQGQDGEAEVLAKIAEMTPPDRAMAEKLHAIVMATAPGLVPRTWYGMPAYTKDGKIICFFQCAAKFKTRYATLGFSDKAQLDDGAMWPTGFALMSITDAEEKRIRSLVKKAVG